MTITTVQTGGKLLDSSTNVTTASLSPAVTSVTSGNLITVSVSCYEPTAGTFVAGDCTKTAGTATIGTVALDKQLSGTNICAGIWSAIVTGSGTITMQVAGTSGDYWNISVGEWAATGGWDSSRLNDSNTGSGTSQTHTTGTMSSPAAGGLFIGQHALEGASNDTCTLDGAFTEIFKETDGSQHQPGLSSYKIVSGANTDAFEDINGTQSLPYVYVGVVYKEVSAAPSGGGPITEGLTYSVLTEGRLVT